jgi:methyl-accepting chemotaxis protein
MEPSFRHLTLLNPQQQELYILSRTSNQTLTKLTPEVKEEIRKQLSAGKTYVGAVYIDETSLEPMVLTAVPIRNVFGDFRGSLVTEVNLKFMWDLVGSLKIGEKGNAYVVNKDGDLLAFTDISRVLRGENLSGLRTVANFMNQDSFTESKASVAQGILGTTVIASYVPLGEPDWAVLVELPWGEAYTSVIRTLITSLLVTLFSLTLAIFAGRYLAQRITDPLLKLRDATRTISKGNLDTRIEIESEDEIGELAINFNRMVESISALLSKTKHAVNVIWEQSTLLRENAGQSAENMSSLAISIEQISKGAMEQTLESEKSSTQANLLADKIDVVSTKAQEIEEITQKTKNLTFNSKETVHLLQEKTTQTDQITGEITSDINELNLNLGKIRGITEVITNITEQTNLLALNAAIEAARAGDAGRGFAVVAMEIDKLASQSLESAKNIERILNGIESLILKSTTNATQAHTIVEEQRSAVDLTSNAFDQIISTLDLIIEHNSQMYTVVGQIDTFKTETLHSIMSISAVSEESAASCEEVTAITEEQSNFADKLKNLASELNDLAGDLMEISKNFIISE